VFHVLKWLRRITRALGYVAGALIIASALVMLYDVVLRYVFNSPSLIAPFLAAFLMMGGIFLGTAHALDFGGHVNVDILITKLKPLPGKICMTIGYALSLVFVYFLTRACYDWVLIAADRGLRAVGQLPMPMVYLYGVMFVGTALLMLSLAAKLFEVWYKKEGKS